MMDARRLGRRLGAVAGAAAIVAFAAACGSSGNESPSSTTTTTTTTAPSSAPVTPTEKNLDPTGGNLFTPTVKAPPPATGTPGVHRNN